MSLQELVDRYITVDVLVVGSGGAALRSAIGSAARDVKTALVSKGKVGKSGVSIMAGADVDVDGKSARNIGLQGDPEDSPEKFMRDILIEGFYLNDQKLVELYVNTAGDRVLELIEWGMPIYLSEGREIYTSGPGIIKALLSEVKRHDIEFFENIMITDLLTTNGRIAGAMGVDIQSGDIVLFRAKSVVLATGGWHKMYSFNTGSSEMSGDGVAAALRAGAKLINMEMVTFCSNVILWPPRWKGSIFLYIFHMLAGGSLLDVKGKPFLDRYYPEKEVQKLATETEWNKLLLSLAEAKTIKEGLGTPHGGVYLAARETSWERIKDTLAAQLMPRWRLHGDDCTRIAEILKNGGQIEVAPAAHYFEGGVKIDEKCESTIKGLYAAGECSGGLFGANRVAAATTEMVVEGAVAGEAAAKYAETADLPPIDGKEVGRIKERLLHPFSVDDGIRPRKLLRRLQDLAYEKMGPIRSKGMLNNVLKEVNEIKSFLPKVSPREDNRNYNLEWVETLELGNLTLLMEATVRATLARTESRGVHYREDYPYVDNDNWLKVIVIGLKPDGSLQLQREPVTTTTIPLPTGRIPYKRYIVDAAKALGE